MDRLIIFAIYSVLFECIIWGMFGYAVFILHHSGWWFLLALIVSSAQLRPRHFGIKESTENNK